MDDLEKAYLEHGDQLRERASRHFGQQNADDVVHDVFVKAYEQPDDVGRTPKQRVRWLEEAVERVAGTDKRRRQRHPVVEYQELPCREAEVAFEVAWTGSVERILNEAMARGKISERAFAAIVLKETGCSNQEIADELKIKVESVNTVLRRGRERAQDILIEAGYTRPD